MRGSSAVEGLLFEMGLILMRFGSKTNTSMSGGCQHGNPRLDEGRVFGSIECTRARID
jgi:hypothetical protein